MASFKDSKGREWRLRIGVGSIGLVRETTGVDIWSLPEDDFKGLAALMGPDLPKFGAVLYCLCHQQVQEQKVSAFDFADELLGDTLRAAADAFYEALADFFPQEKYRQLLRAVKAKSEAYRAVLLDRAAEELEKVNPQAAAQQTIANLTAGATPNASPGSVPASSASTPAPGA